MPNDNEIDEISDGASENEYDDADISKDDHDDENMAEESYKLEDDGDQNGGAEVKKPKLDPKDPLRPRRKKARRACFACQRAHLTCGKCYQVFIFPVRPGRFPGGRLSTRNKLLLLVHPPSLPNCISWCALAYRPMHRFIRLFICICIYTYIHNAMKLT
jgi:hypothetical protein